MCSEFTLQRPYYLLGMPFQRSNYFVPHFVFLYFMQVDDDSVPTDSLLTLEGRSPALSTELTTGAS